MAPPRVKPSSEAAYTVKSLVKALSILDVLAEEEPPYTLTQLSRRLHLHVSTAHRLLVNLVRHGFVEIDPVSGGYHLGYRVLRMGLRVLDRLDFRRAAQPLLRELNLQTKESVQLAILQECRAIFVDQFESPQPVGLGARLGSVLPLHCTAVGKILLAYQSEDLLNEVLKSPGLTRLTTRTITDLHHLRLELEGIRERGYALDHEEAFAGLSCVAGPVFNHAGRIVAAFSVGGPSTRLTPARLPEIARRVRETSLQISHRLGYRPGPTPSGAPTATPTHQDRRSPRRRV